MNAWLQDAALWLWQNSLAAGALAVLVLGVRQTFRGRIAPRWLCLAGWLVMARLFLPAPLTHPWAWDRAWAREAAVVRNKTVPPALTNSVATEAAVDVPELRAEIAAALSTLEAMRASGFGDRHPQIINAGSTLTAREHGLAIVAPAIPALDWLALAVWVWACGAAVYFIYTFNCHLRFMRRLRRTAVPITTVARAFVQDCASVAGLRSAPLLVAIPGGGSPFLCGLFRPRIVLPEETLAMLTPAELRHVLLHEMLHISRRDLATNWLLAFARALHWWNPLIHVAARRLLADREILRDHQAIALLRDPGERVSYGHTLLKLALPLTAPAPTPGLAPLFHSEKELKRRLTMIQSPVRHRRPAACAAAGFLSILCAPLFTTVRGQEKSEPEQKPAPPPAIPAAGGQSFRGIKLLADRMVKNGDTWSGFFGDQKTFEVTEVPAPPQVGSVAEKVAITAWSTKAAEAADRANAVRASYHKRLGQLVLDTPPAAGTAPGPLDNLRAVAAKLREKGQAVDADAIDAELKKLSAPAVVVEGTPPATPPPADSAIVFQQLRAEMAEMRAVLSTLQRLPRLDESAALEAEIQTLGRALKSGLGPKHPKVMGLKESIRLRHQSMADAKAQIDAETKEKAVPGTLKAEAVKPTDQAGDDLPWGVAVPGKKGRVFSPHTPEPSIVDVEGFQKGDKVKCPHTGSFFRVP